MNVRRSWFFFLLMLLLSVCGVLLLAEKPVMENVRSLRGEADSCEWQTVGTGSGKVAVVAGWREGTLVLRYFTTEGAALSEQTLRLPEELSGGVISRLLPVRDGFAYLGIYGAWGEKLYLYRIAEGEEPERLLAITCPGDSFQERSSRTELSELSYEDGVLAFAVRTDRLLDRYICGDSGGVEGAGSGNSGTEPVYSIFSAQNGTLLLGGPGYLSMNGKTVPGLAEDQAVTHLTYGRGGWYYIDAVRLEICFVDAALGATQRMLRLDTLWKGEERSLTSAALTREESAVMLLDGSVLTVTNAEGTRELEGILRPKPLHYWLGLARYGLYALVAAFVLWLLLCGLRRGYASLVVFRGSLFAAAALLCFTLLNFLYLEPMQRSSDLRENEASVSGVLHTVRAETRMEDETLATDVSRILEGVGAEGGGNVRTVTAVLKDGVWRTADGRLAVTLSGFSPALAGKALEDGSASELHSGVFRYARTDGEWALCVRIEGLSQSEGTELNRMLLLCFGIMVLLVVLILLSVGTDVRRISRKMESITRGGTPRKLNMNTGDELESMASIVNSLGLSLRKQEEERESVEHSYRRFVPEKVLALLGKESIRDVDKSAFAARRMAVMTVWFTFPDSMYTDMSNSRLLFDSVNEVIERTASIVARKGGTVFHFAYNGFDVVMEDGGEAMSTAIAIQQEVLSFNELRNQSRLPAVTLRIALDKGNVMLGIVGDTSQMEPTTISSSLSTAQELIDLCNRLKAGILCTEAIILERQDYGSRYMGKCIVGDQSVRVYEVFDGDEFNVRRGKASSMKDFSQGVYDLYGGSAASAKRTFLQLAHNYPQDGGIRYYLYLADRLEHDPSLPCVLNVGKTGGGEM